MLRIALPLSVALLASFGAGASTAATVTPVAGEIRALAFSGDALVVVRVPSRGRLTIERRVAGSPPQTIFATSSSDGNDEVSLAASADALAFGLKPDDDDDFAPSRVMVGPSSGPLREVATCPAGLIVSPVAVFGPRIAWREGACGEPVAQPSSVSPAAIVVGGADPAAPVIRAPIGPERLPVAVVLGAGDTGLVGTVQPSFFGFDTDVRAFSPAGLGATVVADRARLVSAVGVLANGTAVFQESGLDGDDEGECDAQQLFTLAPGASERRPVALGGCLVAAEILGPRGPQSPVATGDRITAFVGKPPSPTSPNGGAVSIVSLRADGSDRRVIVTGGYRQPRGVAVAGGQVAWWQPRCVGDQEIVVQPSPGRALALAACRVEILTRSARLRAGRISVRIRCPVGCSGTIFGRGLGRQFAFEAGTHRLSLRVALGRRASARVRVGVEVAGGPSRSVLIRVRR